MRFFLIIWLIPLALIAKEPDALYLTWRSDPATTMTIHWLTSDKDTECLIDYRKDAESTWMEYSGKVTLRPDFDLAIHKVDLAQLEPDTLYKFRLKGNVEEYTFRTLPQTLSRPVRFAIGGDAYLTANKYKMMIRQIAKTDPDFVVIGGDLAYTHNSKISLFHGWTLNKNQKELQRWLTFFKKLKRFLVGKDGRLIPFLVAIGNHDAQGMQEELLGKTKSLFFDLFSFQEDGVPFRAIDCGNYLSLFLLDTGHRFPVGGQQTQWLEETLQAKGDIPHKIAVYHVAGFPSRYNFAGRTPVKIRRLWVPLFEQYGVKSVFEHHNHAYKRTHPIKDGKIDPNGVVYYGDGGWGIIPVPLRIKFQKPWYLARTGWMNSFWLVTLTQDDYLIESRDIQGRIIESIKRL